MVACPTCGQETPDVDFGIKIEPVKGKVTIHGEEIHMSPRVIQILAVLLAAKGKMVTTEHIERTIYEGDWGKRRNLIKSPVIAVFMSKLRGQIAPWGYTIKGYRHGGYILERAGEGERKATTPA